MVFSNWYDDISWFDVYKICVFCVILELQWQSGIFGCFEKKKYLVNRIAKYETMAYEYTIAKSKYRWVVIEEFTCRQMNYNEIAICKWNHWNVS
jgi:hypothetical protein